MKTSRFTPEQMVMALRQAEGGTPIGDVRRKLASAKRRFIAGGSASGPWGVTELRELRQLRDENRRLKSLVADLSVDKTILEEALRKKW